MHAQAMTTCESRSNNEQHDGREIRLFNGRLYGYGEQR
ncbi:hypothetical protein SynBIOSE41_02371 [Synechococcus sp. BIOS-E4-1]|nr:hypothetical protein SynBIOSE41_02371 [Synechococcus sp. BIOS-E4-1]